MNFNFVYMWCDRLGAYEERLEESEQVRQDEEKRKQEEQKATLVRAILFC